MRPSPARRLVLAAILAGAALAAHPAAASPADVAAAQGLYDEGRRLMKQGHFDAACPKLEESDRLDRSASTEYHLADCYAHVGKTASAWGLFLEVASQSRQQGRADAEQLARKRASELAPKVAHLTVVVPPASQASGLQITRDGQALGSGQWGTAVPLDSGKHVIAATAPGHADWSTTIDVADGGAANVEVPALGAAQVAAAPVAPAEPTAPVAPAPPPPEADRSGGSPWKTIGLVGAGVGLATVGVGAFFGAQAISKNSDSSKDCAGDKCNAAGYATRNDALTSGNVSTVLIGAGAALLVGGAVLWLTAPGASSDGAHAALLVGPGSVGLAGSFR